MTGGILGICLHLVESNLVCFCRPKRWSISGSGMIGYNHNKKQNNRHSGSAVSGLIVSTLPVSRFELWVPTVNLPSKH